MPVPTLGQPVPRKDITLKKNADFSYALCIIERDELGEAVVVDTTGWLVWLQVREEPDESSPIIVDASTEAGADGTITVGIQGDPGEEINIDISIPKAATAAITYEGTAGYDLRVQYPSGQVDYLAEGRAFIQPAFTW